MRHRQILSGLRSAGIVVLLFLVLLVLFGAAWELGRVAAVLCN